MIQMYLFILGDQIVEKHPIQLFKAYCQPRGRVGGGGGGGGGKGNLGVILVWVCEPVFQNLSHSYT